MSFPIKLQYNNDERNKVNKYSDLTDVVTVTGVLRDNCSLIDPVILIEQDLTEEFSKINYMYINKFHRYYFINDIKSVRQGLIEISAHVDVLMTYRHEIANCTGIVKRSKNKWNLYLNDGSFKVYQNPMILAKKFPSGFNTLEFVLAVAGS